MNSEPALRLTEVTLTYPDGEGRVTALADVDLAVPRGAMTVAVGPSGSGKSSLLAVAATLVTPDRGSVVVAGRETGGLSRGELARLRREHLGIVFQSPNLLPALTAREQLAVRARMTGRGGHRLDRRIDDLLEAVGLSDQADRHPAQLSGGQQQRVNIARALVVDPDVLLVDEPTSALDHERGQAVMGLLRRLASERQVATLLVTHDTALLDPADRIVEVHDGRVRRVGSVAEVPAPTLSR